MESTYELAQNHLSKLRVLLWERVQRGHWEHYGQAQAALKMFEYIVKAEDLLESALSQMEMKLDGPMITTHGKE